MPGAWGRGGGGEGVWSLPQSNSALANEAAHHSQGVERLTPDSATALVTCTQTCKLSISYRLDSLFLKLHNILTAHAVLDSICCG
eukprot:scaffold34115_cov30-Tisochrysis_lutea.AAC.2